MSQKFVTEPLHLVLHFGESGTPAKCDCCNAETMLVTACSLWRIHRGADVEDDVHPADEVSGNYCPECGVLTAIFVHIHRPVKGK